MFNDHSTQWQPLNFRDISLAQEDGNKKKNGSEQSLSTEHKAPFFDSNDTDEKKSSITENAQEEEKNIEALLEESYQKGYTDGRAEGYQEGYIAGQKEGIETIKIELEEQAEKEKMLAIQSIVALVANFQKALNEIDEEIVPTLTNLAMTVAKKLVDSLPDTAYLQLRTTISELIRELPILGKNVYLHLNPNDLGYAHSLLAEDLAKYDWHLISDPSIEAGGCRVLTEKNEIDATLGSKYEMISEVISEGSN